MNIPEDLKYSSDHEWVSVDSSVVTVGITDFAQDALGDVVFIELPEVGAATAAGEAISEVESTKSVSDIVAPVNGTILEVNDALDDDPTLVNSDPYGEGWIFKVAITDLTALDNLMDHQAYRELCTE